MWNIAICDSDAAFVKELEIPIRECYEAKGFQVDVRWYSSGAEFVEGVDAPVNLIFLNTRLSDMKGYALAEMLRARRSRALLVFLSDHDEDVFDAFRYRPFRYMRKSMWRDEIEEVLASLWREDHKERSIRIQRKRGDIMVPLDDIIYLESKGHYVHFHCIDHTFQIRAKLSKYEEMLKGRYFVHPSKSFLVNCAHIESFGAAVQLKTGERLNCSKSRKREAERIHQKYLEEIAHYL